MTDRIEGVRKVHMVISDGESARVESVRKVTYVYVSNASAQGPTGPAGAAVLNGTVDPTASDGANGDFFLNTTTSTLFGPKATGVWPTPGTSLIGPTGPTGDTGPQGDPGEGVPAGGTTAQVLKKASATDYDTEWADETGGGGAVDSVNGQTGVVVLDTDDIAEGATNLYFTTARVSANADVTANTAARHTHTNSAVLAAITDAGSGIIISSVERTKLSGIEAGAEVNTVDSVFGRTGAVVAAANDYTWEQVDKTVSDLADLTTRSHTSLTDIGTNTHAQLDTHVASISNPHSVTKTQVGLSNVTNDAQLKRAANDISSFPNKTADGFDWMLVEDLTTGVKYAYFVRDLPISDLTQNALNLKSSVGHLHSEIDLSDLGTLIMRRGQNLNDVSNRQTSLNNLTAVSGATNEYVLTKDTSTGNALWKAASGGVTSVNSQTGVVVLDTDDIGEGATNLYYTEARVSANTDVAANTAHRGTTTGNPHSVTLSDVGGTTDHTALSNIGTNTHAQIDTHLALTNEHIDWTNATSNLTTTGLVTSNRSVAGSGSLFFADANIPFSGSGLDVINGFDIDYDVTIASGTFNFTTVRGIRFRYDVVDNGAAFHQQTVQIIDGRINAGGLPIVNNDGSQPMYYEFTNPISTQEWPNGFMRVNVAGGSSGGTTVAFFSQATVAGTQAGIGYRGYATATSGHTVELVGVQGYIVRQTGANSSALIGLEAITTGASSTPADKIMGFRTQRHGLMRSGSLFILTGSATTPNGVTTTHLDPLTNTGELYAQGNVEIDGELFCDGNISKAVTDVSSTPHTVSTTDTMVDASSGAHVENLPAISGLSGNREVLIKKIDSSANTVTVTANGSDTIDGSATTVLSSQYDFVRLVAGNGTEWHITG